MHDYKVIFENNEPILANLLPTSDTSNKDSVKFTRHGRKRSINWLVVPGYNEKDAIAIAYQVVHDLWAKFLG